MNDESYRNGAEEKEEKLVVFYVEPYSDKGGLREAGSLRDKLKGFVVKSKEIAVDDFKYSLSRFLLTVENILSTSKQRYGDFIMDSIEINAEVSADGKVGFMGTEVGVSGTHGIKFVFKRSMKTL